MFLKTWQFALSFLHGIPHNSVSNGLQKGFIGLTNSRQEKAMAPHSSTLAWKIPWTEEPGRLQSMGSLRVRHDWATSFSLFTFMHWRRKWQPTPVFLPGESQGRGSLVGCRLWGRTVGHESLKCLTMCSVVLRKGMQSQDVRSPVLHLDFLKLLSHQSLNWLRYFMNSCSGAFQGL